MNDRYYENGSSGYAPEGRREPATRRIPTMGEGGQPTPPRRRDAYPTEPIPNQAPRQASAVQLPWERQSQAESGQGHQAAYQGPARADEVAGWQDGAATARMSPQHQAPQGASGGYRGGAVGGYGGGASGGYGGGAVGGYGAAPSDPSTPMGPAGPSGPAHVGGGPDRSEPRGRKGSGAGKSFLMGVLGGILVLAIAAAGFFGYNALANPGSGTLTVDNADGTQSTYTINASGGDAELSEAVAAKALPSVVSIDVYSQAQSYYSMFNLMEGSDEESDLEVSAFGSGVIISEDGYIITNYHVVEGGEMFVVHFDDDSTAEATFVGGDGSSDIAVLKVDRQGLVPMEIGDSSQLKVGEWVMTIGAPFGLTKSCSAGIVSALYRNETLENTFGTSFYVNMIQVDANVNPGNSGGALVNSKGELVGINTITTSYTGDFAGIGMAIPSNYAMNIANQIIETGEVHYSFLGVQLGTVDAGTQRYYGVSVDKGAYVGRVVEGGPAEAAGVQEGDVIVSYNGKEVTTAAELIMDVRASNVGDEVELGIKRGNEDLTLTATLALDTNSQASQPQEQQEQQGQERMQLP